MKKDRTSKNILLVFLAVVVALLVLFFTTSTAEFGAKKPSSFNDLGGDFELQTDTGNISLKDFEGELVVMYFGFLNCPDVCPNSMLTMASALKRLPADSHDDVNFLMVSVDPERDDLEALAEFAAFYGDQFIGATGSSEQLKQVTDAYAAYFELGKANRTGDYEVRHSSRYYIIDASGQLRDAMRHSTTANELAARITEVMNSNTI